MARPTDCAQAQRGDVMNTSDDHRVQKVDVIDKLRNRIARLRQCLGNRPRPIITLTYAQSIDGCIAPFGGGTLQLSNSKSQQLTHQIRTLHDAILVGINTVLCDDPRLTVRLANGNDPQPIVLDSRLRFPLDANLMRDPCIRPIIATGQDACENKENQLIAAGARVIRVPLQADGLIDLSQLFLRIGQMGFDSVMVEGGSKVITNVLASQIADQIILAIAPKFVGGLRAVNPNEAWEQMPQIHDVHCQMMDGDLVVWGQLRSANVLNRSLFPQTGVSRSLPECPANAKGEEPYDEC